MTKDIDDGPHRIDEAQAQAESIRCRIIEPPKNGTAYRIKFGDCTMLFGPEDGRKIEALLKARKGREIGAILEEDGFVRIVVRR